MKSPFQVSRYCSRSKWSYLKHISVCSSTSLLGYRTKLRESNDRTIRIKIETLTQNIHCTPPRYLVHVPLSSITSYSQVGRNDGVSTHRVLRSSGRYTLSSHSDFYSISIHTMCYWPIWSHDYPESPLWNTRLVLSETYIFFPLLYLSLYLLTPRNRIKRTSTMKGHGRSVNTSFTTGTSFHLYPIGYQGKGKLERNS